MREYDFADEKSFPPSLMSAANRIAQPCFIHSRLDEYGLSSVEFRLYCRVARCGDCWQTVETIAAGCRVGVKTVRSGLKFLVGRGLLSKEPRIGTTQIYRCTPFDAWLPPLAVNTGGLKRKGGTVKRNHGGLPNGTTPPLPIHTP